MAFSWEEDILLRDGNATSEGDASGEPLGTSGKENSIGRHGITSMMLLPLLKRNTGDFLMGTYGLAS